MIRTVFFVLPVITAACAKPPAPPATAVMEASVAAASFAPPAKPAGMPDLCDVDGGRWCVECPAGGCPQAGKTGALCCAGGFCVEWTGGQCSGILGWCENYTLEKDQATGINVATCHDVD